MMEVPLWERILVAAVGPIVAAIVGTLFIGWVVGVIARRTQRQQEEHRLRIQLLTEMVETSVALYLQTQQYWRVVKRETADERRRETMRDALDTQYQSTRRIGAALENRLAVLLVSPSVVDLWHATIDLLTVRYFSLIDLATEELLRRNAKDEKTIHSGLSLEELKNPTVVLVSRI
jgi:hypothetical protein